jgi:hypothetical protein
MRIKELLQLETIPYFLSVLFLAVGWSITYVAGKVEKFPLLEYHLVVSEKDNATYTYEYTITNITTDKLFKNLEFFFDYRNDAGFIIDSATFYGVPPASFSAEHHLSDVLYAVPITSMQPGNELVVKIVTKSSIEPALRFESDQEILLSEQSYLTWLYKNSLYLIFALIIVWLLLILLYLNEYTKRKPSRRTRRT